MAFDEIKSLVNSVSHLSFIRKKWKNSIVQISLPWSFFFIMESMLKNLHINEGVFMNRQQILPEALRFSAYFNIK